MSRVLPIDQSEVTLFNPADAKARKERLWRVDKKMGGLGMDVDRRIQSRISEKADYHDSMMIEAANSTPPSKPWPMPSDDAVAHYKLVFSTVAFDRPTVRQIVCEIAKMHDVTVDEIFGPRRTKMLVRARHHAFYEVTRKRPDMSFPQIAKAMGGKDHSSALHAVRRFAEANGLPTLGRAKGVHPVRIRYGKQT